MPYKKQDIIILIILIISSISFFYYIFFTNTPFFYGRCVRISPIDGLYHVYNISTRNYTKFIQFMNSTCYQENNIHFIVPEKLINNNFSKKQT